MSLKAVPLLPIILLIVFSNSSKFYCSAEIKLPPNVGGGTLRVKSVPSLYINEIKQVTLYEATIPIFFHIKLPEIPDIFPLSKISDSDHFHNCTGSFEGRDEEYRNYYCALEREFFLASNHVMKDLQEQRTQLKHETKTLQEENGSRKRRQVAPVIAVTSLVAGFLLRPAISKYTGSLFGTNEEWSSHFNQMRDTMIREHEILVNFENSTNSFNQAFAGALTNVSETLTEQRRDLIWTLRLLAMKMHADQVQDALNSCKTKYLPSNLIPLNFLQETLGTLNINLETKFNYTLTISYENKEIGRYYKLPIVDCLFSQDKAHITLNIPVKQKNAQWKLYDVVHTKFAFKGQVCDVYPQEASYLAEESLSKRTVLITNHMLKYCSIFEHQLCMIPLFSRDSVQSLKCSTLATLSSREGIRLDYEELVKSCSYRCYTSNELMVTQVNPLKVVVTNAEKISFQCGLLPKRELKIQRLGAIEINLNCDCTIILNDQELLPKPFPCKPTKANDDNANVQIKDLFHFTLPLSWSHNFTTLNLEIGNHEEMRHHVNHEWPWSIPVLNFTKENDNMNNFTIPEKATMAYGSILSTLEIWLVILTIAIVFNFTFTIYCFFKLVMDRYRAYEFSPYPAPMARQNENFLNEIKVTKKEQSPKCYYHSPARTECERLSRVDNTDEDGISKIEEGDTGEVERRRSNSVDKQDKDSYQNNRWSVTNKLI